MHGLKRKGPHLVANKMPENHTTLPFYANYTRAHGTVFWRDAWIKTMESNPVESWDFEFAKDLTRFLKASAEPAQERLEEAGVFWDVGIVLLKKGADASVDAMFSLFHLRDASIGENMLNVAVENNHRKGIEWLMKNGWEKRWVQRQYMWESLAWRNLAVDSLCWMRESKPADAGPWKETRLDEEDVDSSRNDFFMLGWGHLAESVNIVNEGVDVKMFGKRLSAFLRVVGDDLAFSFEQKDVEVKRLLDDFMDALMQNIESNWQMGNPFRKRPIKTSETKRRCAAAAWELCRQISILPGMKTELWLQALAELPHKRGVLTAAGMEVDGVDLFLEVKTTVDLKQTYDINVGDMPQSGKRAIL
jgi:hypothetical protein